MNKLRNVAYVLCFGVGAVALAHYIAWLCWIPNLLVAERLAGSARIPSRAT